jgi:hypothetical protein
LLHREKCGVSALFVSVSALFVNVPGCKNPRVCCGKFRDDARKIGFASLWTRAFGSTPIRGPGEVPDGEVDAYPRNTRFVAGNGWNSVG